MLINILRSATIKRMFLLIYSIFFTSAYFIASHASDRAQKLPSQAENPKQYIFTEDFMTPHIRGWEERLGEFKGKPGLNYLEIGVFEGRSATWMLENILTHETAHLTGIDIFPNNLEEIYLENIKRSGYADKVTTIKGESQIELKRLPLDSFDIIYIDGSHRAAEVLTDAVLSWQLLKDGGLVIFDDYLWRIDDYPLEFRPKIALEAFLTAYRNSLVIVSKGAQVFLRKNTQKSYYGIPIGQYVFSWTTNNLSNLKERKNVELSEQEISLLKKLIRARDFGEVDFSPACKRIMSDELKNLIQKLNIDFGYRKAIKPRK